MKLTDSDLGKIHRAGLGGYRPMGDKVTARVDALTAAGYLWRNPDTGIYVPTDKGLIALATR